MPLRPLLALIFFAAAATSVACTRSSQNLAQSAAFVGTAVAVAAAGVNRAVTGDCWASCREGMVCDHATGFCVESNARLGPAFDGPNPNPPGQEFNVPPLPVADADPDAGPD